MNETNHKNKSLLLGFFAVNLIPIVGVSAFNWSLATVAVFYWFAAGVIVLFDALEGLFAAKPLADERFLLPFHELRSKRGAFRLASWLPPIYPRNIPLTLVVLEGFAIIWPAAGAALYVLGADAAAVSDAWVSLLVGALVIVTVRTAWFVEYLRTERYATESARTVIRPGAVFGLIGVVFVGMLLWGAEGGSGRTGIAAALAVLVGTPLAVELGRVVAAVGESSRIAALSERLGTDGVGTESDVTVPDGEPIARFRPEGRAVAIRGLVRGIGKSLNPELPVLLLGLGVLVGWLLWGRVGTVALGATIVLLSALLTMIVDVLLYGYLEYRVYANGDANALVAYDRLLETPQWRVPVREITAPERQSGFLERVTTGTATVRIPRGERSAVRLVCLPDPDRLIGTLEPAGR